MEHADDPAKEKAEYCELHDRDPEKCERAGAGPDPCRGCKAKEWLDFEPEHPRTEYCFFLYSYIEAFRPSPERLTWLDMEYYHCYVQAKNQVERARWKKGKE